MSFDCFLGIMACDIYTYPFGKIKWFISFNYDFLWLTIAEDFAQFRNVQYSLFASFYLIDKFG